jgi:hypothetical protein
MFNETVQGLARLSYSIARASGESEAWREMNSLLQIRFDKLRHIEENLPLILKRNKVLLGPRHHKFADEQDKCHHWLDERCRRRIELRIATVQRTRVTRRLCGDSLSIQRTFPMESL